MLVGTRLAGAALQLAKVLLTVQVSSTLLADVAQGCSDWSCPGPAGSVPAHPLHNLLDQLKGVLYVAVKVCLSSHDLSGHMTSM